MEWWFIFVCYRDPNSITFSPNSILTIRINFNNPLYRFPRCYSVRVKGQETKASTPRTRFFPMFNFVGKRKHLVPLSKDDPAEIPMIQWFLALWYLLILSLIYSPRLVRSFSMFISFTYSHLISSISLVFFPSDFFEFFSH